MKRIVYIGFWISIVLGTIVMLSFSRSKQNNAECKEMLIKIDSKKGMHFIDEDDVLSHLRKTGMYPVGKKMQEVNLGKLEKSLEEIPEVKDAEVYSTLDGKLGINIMQRVPIIRVIPDNGKSFYIDENGYQMPISEKYYPRLIIVTGKINDAMTTLSAREISLRINESKKYKTDEIFRLAKYITKDEFWSAQIQQIDITRDGEFELIPTVGDHRIIFGTLENMKGKFEKLFIFYKEGISNVGWENYKTVNVKYKHQIICTKK